jgi:hypothetical protein
MPKLLKVNGNCVEKNEDGEADQHRHVPLLIAGAHF